MSYQVEIVSLDQLIDKNHNYRKFKELWDLYPVKKELEKIEISLDADNGTVESQNLSLNFSKKQNHRNFVRNFCDFV